MDRLRKKETRIAVIGDLMIDHYLWGRTERISPEAPVPVIDVREETEVLGGAGNVVNNLVALVDRNYISATDFTENLVQLEPLDEKWRAFGWRVKRINGHSFPEIFDALEGVRSRRSARPLVIIADTVKGKGVKFISDDPMWHSCAPTEEQVKAARKELNKEYK